MTLQDWSHYRLYITSVFKCQLQETLLIHKDLIEKGWLNDIILDLRTEGMISSHHSSYSDFFQLHTVYVLVILNKSEFCKMDN